MAPCRCPSEWKYSGYNCKCMQRNTLTKFLLGLRNRKNCTLLLHKSEVVSRFTSRYGTTQKNVSYNTVMGNSKKVQKNFFKIVRNIERPTSIFLLLCLCVCLRPSTLKTSSVWGWKSRVQINDVVLKT